RINSANFGCVHSSPNIRYFREPRPPTMAMAASASASLPVPSADVLRLVQAHLIESGLRSSASALRAESGGVGLPGLLPSTKGTLVDAARGGRWGEALKALDGLDLERAKAAFAGGAGGRDGDRGDGGDGDEGGDAARGDGGSGGSATPLERAVALAHETAVLELAEVGETDLAYAALRMCADTIDRALRVDDDDEDDDGEADRARGGGASGRGGLPASSRSGDVERRITALSSNRRAASSSGTNGSSSSLLPADYYGPSNPPRQKRRDRVAKLLGKHVPEVTPRRLLALLGQSVRWQCHTGTFPAVRKLFRGEEEDEEEGNLLDEEGGDDEDGKKKKKKKKKRGRVERRFDLVLGAIDLADGGDGKKRRRKDGDPSAEKIPSRPFQTIRLGKKCYVESAIFLPDGRGLVTGSSDGFVEIWGEPVKDKEDRTASKGETGGDASSENPLLSVEIDYEKLRTSDLPYQKDDDLMTHDAPVLAMDVSSDGRLLGTASSDGTVCVWKVEDGKLLRKLERAHGGIGGGGDRGAAVTCIQFSPDGSKILTGGHDSTCREFGLLASRMLKEFRGHSSYVNCCSYAVLPPSVVGGSGRKGHGGAGDFLAVVTASADGTVRIWDGRTAEPIREVVPPIPTSANASVEDKDSITPSKSVHTVVHLHDPPNAMIVVPRSDRAYLMSYAGEVLRAFARDDVPNTEFLAAAVSPSNRWLYVAADDGKCVTFDIQTGTAEKIVRTFAEECSSGRGERACEISGLVCHPHRGLLGGFCSDKGQKRGMLTLWK
ncbi:hypothetical protein ACHAWF_006944, partial [Thalassiosira exigua]